MTPGNPVLDKEGFRRIIVGLSGLSDNAVVWKTSSEPFVSDVDRARIVLSVFSLEGNGWDEYRRELGPPGYPKDAYVTTTIGNRTLKITMRAEAFDKDVEASEILDGVYTNMQTVAADLDLDAIKLAFEDASPTTAMSYVVDERVVNTAVRDFSFLAIARRVVSVELPGQAADNAGAPGTTIDTVDAGDGIIPGTLTP